MLVGTAITGQSARPPITLASLHPRDGDDDVGAHELLQVGEQPVEPGVGGLLGHRHVAGAAGGHHDLAGPVGAGRLPTMPMRPISW